MKPTLPNFLAALGSKITSFKNLSVLVVVLLLSGGAWGQVTDLSQGFEGGAVPPTLWSNLNGGTGNTWGISTTSYSGTKAASYTYNSTNAANAHLISSGVACTSGTVYTITFYTRSSSFTEKIGVKAGTTQSIAGMTLTLLAETTIAATSTTYSQKTITWTAPSTATYYFDWNCTSAANMNVLYIDDILITHPSPAPTITSLGTSSGCPGSSITINGTNLTGATAVKIGGTAVSSITSNSGTSIVAVVGSGTTGTVAVTTPGGTATSAATYTINALPTISASPSATTQNVCLNGTPATLSVTAAPGSGSISTYQWYSNSSASASGGTTVGTNSATYTPLATTAGTLYYYVTVTNSNGCSTTSTVSGAVNVAAGVPVISTPPANASVATSGNTTFTTVATNLPTSYSWEVSSNSGSTWTTISNGGVYTTATTATLTITGATYTMNGYQYRVTATNTCGNSTVSTAGTLTVTYCTPSGHTSGTDYISNVTINTLNNVSVYGGYVNYSATGTQTTTLYSGSSYNLTISSGSGSGTHGAAVWIDFNNNGLFTDSGEYFLISNAIGPSATTSPISISVPSGAFIGNVRMRVRYSYNVTVTSSMSCTMTVTYGDTEDYTLSIAPPPTLVQTGTFSSFTSCSGSVSAEQSYTVSGTNLTAALVVTAPTGFEVSTTSGSGFANTVSLTPSTGTVATTTIYVRVAASATGTPSGNLSATSTNATTLTKAVSDTISAVTSAGTVSGNQTICAGSQPASNLTATPTTGSIVKWQKASDAAFTSPTDIAITSSTLTTSNVGTLSTTTYFRTVVQNGVCASDYSTNYVTVTVNQTTDAGTVSGDQTAVCLGSNFSTDLTATPVTGSVIKWQQSSDATFTNPIDIASSNSNTLTGASVGALSADTYFRTVVQNGVCASAYSSNYVTITTTACTTPIISASGTLSAFTACVGFVSSEKTFTVAASNLTEDLLITAPSGFEVSSSTGTGFGSTVSLTPNSGSIASTTIFVRVTNTASGTLSGSIVSTSAGAPTINVAVSGSLSNVSNAGTVSGDQTICAGSQLSSNLTATPTTGSIVKWQKASDTAFTSPTDIAITSSTLTPANVGSLSATTYFRTVVQNSPCAVSYSSNYVTVTAKQLSTAAVISGSATICAGASTNLQVTITNGDGPFTLIYSNGTSNTTVNNYTSGASITVSPSTNKSYTIVSIANSNGCLGTGNSGTAAITVNALPIINAATSSANPICSGTPTTLTATTNVTTTGNSTLGVGGTSSSSASTGSIFGGTYGGLKTQYIIKSSELTALGIVAGNITSLAFEATTAFNGYEGFALNIGHTSATVAALPLITTGLTQVYYGAGTNGAYATTIGVNTLTFSNPFNWDGISNIVLSFCWSKNPTATSTTSTTILVDTPGFTCAAYGQKDSTLPASFCPLSLASDFGTSGTGTNRPKFTFAGQKSGTGAGVLTWSWSDGTSTVGTANNSISVSPTVATTYTPTGTNAAGCSANGTPIQLNISTAPSAPAASATAMVLTPTNTAVAVSFTASASTTGYLVVRTISANAPTNPTDGTTYAAGSSVLGGTIAYSGTATSFTENGLSLNTAYWYWVFPYNSLCAFGPIYKTTSPLSGTTTTLNYYNWIGVGNGGTTAQTDFNTASNWNPNSVPSASDNVQINVSDTGLLANATIGISSSVTIANLVVKLTTINSVSSTGSIILSPASGVIFKVSGSTTADNIVSGSGISQLIFQTATTNSAFVFQGAATFNTVGTGSLFLRGLTTTPPVGSKFEFDGDLTLGASSLTSTTNYPASWVFDGTGIQNIIINSTQLSLPSVIIGNINSPIVNISGSANGSIANAITTSAGLTINNSSILNLGTKTLNRDVAGGILAINNSGTLKLGASTGGQTGSNFPLNYSTIILASGSTVEYNSLNGVGQTIYATPTYGNLTLSNGTGSGTTTKTAGGALTVAGNLTIGALATFAAGTSLTHNIAGDWTNNGTFSYTTGSTINFNGSNALQTISGSATTSFGTLTVNKGTSVSNILDLTSSILVSTVCNYTAGLIRVTSGTYTYNGSNPTITLASGLHINGGTYITNAGSITNNGWIKISSGTASFGTGAANNITNSITGYFEVTGGTVNIAGRIVNTANGTANSGVGGTGVAISGGILNISTTGNSNGSSASFDMSTTSNLNITGGTIVIQAPNTNATPFNDINILNSTGTKSITGGTFQIGNSNTAASKTFLVNSAIPIYNFTINATNTPNIKLVSNNLSIGGVLTMNGGNIDGATNSKDVVVTNSATTAIVRTSGYINGNLTRALAFTGVAYDYPIGLADSANYLPTSFNFTDLTSGNLTVKANNLDETNIATSSINNSKSVNAYWALSGSAASTNYAGTVTYTPSITDASITETAFKIGKFNTTWSYPTVTPTPSTTSLTFTGASGLGNLAVGECKTPSTSNAGNAQSICVNDTATLTGNNPSNGTGTWTVSGPSTLTSQFSNVNSYNAVFTPAGGDGTYTLTWTIDLPSPCSSPSTSTVTITVIPTNTAGTASSSPTICANTLLTNITHSTTGATGISNSGVSGSNGLPAGVSAAWASNTITISGTPTASGTFNYTIPLTGGCGSVNATGTITVNSLPTTPVLTGSLACAGTTGSITSSTSVSGVDYQLYDSSDTSVGTAISGTGSGLTWSSIAIANGYYVKATNTTTTCVSSNSNPVNVGTITTKTWTANSGNWSDSSNWECGSVPTTNSSDVIVINQGSPVLNTNFTVGAGGSLTISGTSTTFTISPTSTLTVTGTANFGGKAVTIKSNSTGNGAIGQVTGNNLTGATNVTVERYIPAKRSWRAITAPVTMTTSINANWQEGSPVTGNGYGFDIWSNSGGTGIITGGSGSSLLAYDSTTNNTWSAITNTTSASSMMDGSKNKPFMAFVTGPYGTNNVTAGATETTLRATGTLLTGDKTYTTVANKYTFIGNPYASPLDLTAVFNAGDNAAYGGNVWVWDANVLGTNNVGTYNLFDFAATNYTNLTNNGNITGVQIQSGQAFFVKSAADATFTIKETHKGSAWSNAVFRTAAPELLRVGLYKQVNNEWLGRDGTMTVILADANANQVPNKMANGTENIVFTKNGASFASNHHLPLVASDILNVKVWNTTAGANYKLKINTEQFTATNLDATLEDLFTNSRTPLALDGSAVEYPFTVTTDALSSGDRFRIVFQTSALGTTIPKANAFSIVPNPVTGDSFQVNLGTLATGSYSYSICNAIGQEVEKGSINTTSQNTNYTVKFRETAATGIYIMKIKGSDNSVFTAKLIKK